MILIVSVVRSKCFHQTAFLLLYLALLLKHTTGRKTDFLPVVHTYLKLGVKFSILYLNIFAPLPTLELGECFGANPEPRKVSFRFSGVSFYRLGAFGGLKPNKRAVSGKHLTLNGLSYHYPPIWDGNDCLTTWYTENYLPRASIAEIVIKCQPVQRSESQRGRAGEHNGLTVRVLMRTSR